MISVYCGIAPHICKELYSVLFIHLPQDVDSVIIGE